LLSAPTKSLGLFSAARYYGDVPHIYTGGATVFFPLVV